MQNGIKLAMLCATKQKWTGLARKSLEESVVHNLELGYGEHFLAHLNLMKSYSHASFVMPWLTTIFTKLLPDTNVRKMATELNDTHLLVKLASGHMVATDAVYHKQYLTALFTRHRSSAQGGKASAADNKLACDSIAFAELVSYIEELRDTVKSIVELSNVVQLYKSRVEQLGGDTSQCINATRLKEKLLAQIPDLETHEH